MSTLVVQESWARCVVAQLARGKIDIEALGAVCPCHHPCWGELENVAYPWAAVPAAERQSFSDTGQESCMIIANVLTDSDPMTQCPILLYLISNAW